ncbi:MAG: FAD-dependent oxidoreductase [Myxococcota bacterium]
MSEDDLEFSQHGTLRLGPNPPLPEVLDLLVAGGGPAGTAAALRARELGLSVLVLDSVELMKRIRDYPKSKPILPNYGGTEDIPFPSSDALVARLPFDAIDKDELADRWRALYAEFDVPAKVGCELQGLEEVGDGSWNALVWNHRAAREEQFRARSVVLAVGAGVQRRLDIPGDCEGIAYGLEDPSAYVGRPALVIGGGTSAAEAVLAISNAKAGADDPTAVFWSYRGQGMPAVSKALADAFFDAYVRNGNIRSLRLSDPTAVVVGPDKQEVVSLRVDRKSFDGTRPDETLHYEFPKSAVVACIGADPPFSLLRDLGALVPEVKGQARMLVDANGQTSLSGVYLVGDARGLQSLRCEAFEDSTGYQVVTEKRNIKAAMADALLAVEAAARRIPGAPRPPGRAAPTAAGPVPQPEPARAPQGGAAGAPRVVPGGSHAPAELAGGEGPALLMLSANGNEEHRVTLRGDVVELGRKAGDLSFADDVYLDGVHARLRLDGETCQLEDAGSTSGTWLRVQGAKGTRLSPGDQIWLSRQLLEVLRAPDGTWIARHYGPGGEVRGDLPVPGTGVFIGRASQWRLDPADAALSKRHAQLLVDAEGLRVVDRGARNGTYLRVRGPVVLRSGDEFRIGTQRLRFERSAPLEDLEATDVTVVPTARRRLGRPPASAAAAAAQARAPGQPRSPARAPAGERAAAPGDRSPAADPSPSAAQGPSSTSGDAVSGEPEGAIATLRGPGGAATFPVAPGQSILAAYLASGGRSEAPLAYECEKGLCGYCAVEIREGAENFEACDPGSPELATLETAAMLDPDPQRHRLACLSRISGPVVLVIPE